MTTRFKFRYWILFAMVIVCLTIVSSLTAVQATGAATCAVPSTSYPAVQAAVDDPGCEIINIGSGTFYEEIAIDRPLALIGSGVDHTILDGAAGGAVLTIKTTAVTLRGLTITNGSSDSGGGIYNEETTITIENCRIRDNYASWRGGGIYSKNGDLVISDSTIDGNEANMGGGLVNEKGLVEIIRSTVRNNDAAGHAGGIFNYPDSEMVLSHVTIQDNTTYVDGGGIFNSGTITINSSSIHGNKSTNYSGGAIRNEGGTYYINNSTISKNESWIDGPISSWGGTIRLSSSTVTDNIGAPALDVDEGNVRIKNSIVSGNDGQDCSGTVRSDGYNLVGKSVGCDFKSGPGDILNVPVHLGNLEGNPAYHPLLPGPGINSGNPAGCLNHIGELLESDQRGMPRAGRCDIGSFEYQGEYHLSFMPLAAGLFCTDFYDDFSNPNSGWPVGEDDYVQAGYHDGEYRIRSKRSDYFYSFISPSCDRRNYLVEVDARWESKPGLAYGLILSLRGDYERFYLFAVNSEYQVFWLDYYGPGGWVTLIDPVEHGAIKKNQASNHFKAVRDGNSITLKANGELLARISDDRIGKAGGSGVFSVPYEDRGDSDVRFDNYVSRSLANDHTALSFDRPFGFNRENDPNHSLSGAPGS